MARQHRSPNKDLYLGTIDGVFKQITPNRGGQVDMHAPREDAALLPPQYGVQDHVHNIVQGCGCGFCTGQ